MALEVGLFLDQALEELLAQLALYLRRLENELIDPGGERGPA